MPSKWKKLRELKKLENALSGHFQILRSAYGDGHINAEEFNELVEIGDELLNRINLEISLLSERG